MFDFFCFMPTFRGLFAEPTNPATSLDPADKPRDVESRRSQIWRNLQLRLRGIIFFAGIVSLQACQTTNALRDDVVQQNTASGYNVQLGLEYLKQGNIERSKRKLWLALEQAPRSPDANAAMAYFMEKTGDPKKARVFYQKAMAAAPGKGAQLNNYGAFLCRQRDYEQAERYFLKSVDDVQYEHTAGAFENAGLCALAIPNVKKAQQYFAEALKHDPSREQSLYELVKIEMNQSHYRDALFHLQNHSNIVLHSKALLTLAVKTSHQLGKFELEAQYRNWRKKLELSGVTNHDNDPDNG